MTLFRARLLAAALLLAAGALAITPVPALDLLAYVGRWYQVFTDRFSSLTGPPFCGTANYGIFPNYTVSVHNDERVGGAGGTYIEVFGWASLTPGAPGELSVHLQIVPMVANYWVVALGPVNAEGLYDYSVVTGPDKEVLLVLARNVSTFYRLYNASVYDTLLNFGFDGPLNSPVPVSQDGCSYPPP